MENNERKEEENMNRVDSITCKGDIREALTHFQATFVVIIANAKNEREGEDLTDAFAQLLHLTAKALGATFPFTDEESVQIIIKETKEQIIIQRQLISLAKKRDSAQNN